MERITYTVTHDITSKLDAASQGEILTLISNEPDPLLADLQAKAEVFHATKNLYIKNLSITAELPSLPQVPPPEIKNTDSDTTAMIKTLDTEWNPNRKELELLKWDITNSQWVRKARVSLINLEGYPYREYNLYDFLTANLIYELGQEAKLGLRIREIGSGFLSGDDFVSIDGNYVCEYMALVDTNVYGGNGISEPEIPASIGAQILSIDPAWTLLEYEIRSDPNVAGEITIGYWLLRNKLHLLIYGGGATNGDLKKIQLIGQSNNVVIVEKNLNELLTGQDRNTRVNIQLDIPPEHYGKMGYLKLIDNDATGQTYSFFAIDPIYIFSLE